MSSQNLKLALLTAAFALKSDKHFSDGWFVITPPRGKMQKMTYRDAVGILPEAAENINEEEPKMSSPTQCIDCEKRANKFRYDGVRDWCTLLQRDVTQSCFGHNTPRACPKRDENKKGGTEVSNQKKPRICEVLGVEVGEKFEIAECAIGLVHIGKEGHLENSDGLIVSITLSDIINHPEKIIRKPKFTPDDLELMRHIHAVFGLSGIYRTSDGKLWVADENYILELPKNILLCIKADHEIVELKQVLKEEDQCH